MAEYAIRAEGLAKSFKRTPALRGIDLAVPPGTVCALLGRNGAGKTTAVRILTTLLRPDAGTAGVAGFDVLREPAEVRARIGVAGQGATVDELLTGRQNLRIVGQLMHLPAAVARRRADELLGQFGLADAAGRLVRGYSGGMRRRLDIATVLVHRPAVLFLDEPTTGLDPEGRAALWAVLTHLAAEAGTTILVTTHYLEEADQYAAKIAIVDQGRIVAEGTAGELKSRLDGDSVLLELDDSGRAERVRLALAEVPQVRQATREGSVVRARVADGPRALPAVLAEVEASGVPVQSVRVARPSLDDVYLYHAGRSFHQAERIAV